MAKISLILTAASLDNHLVLNARCNCRPLVLVVFDASPGKPFATAKQQNTSIIAVLFVKCFRSFVHCTNLRQYSKRPKRGGAHDNAQIPNLQLQPSVAVATCRKTCFPQFVLLQYKQNHILWLSEFRVPLQNIRVSF